MRPRLSKRHLTGGMTVLMTAMILAASLLPMPSGQALPIYSRRYGVTCQTCHSVAPRLNSFGRAFQANDFNWPGSSPPAGRSGLSALPISGLATYSSVHDLSADISSSDFRTLELFASGGFGSRIGHGGGYFVDDNAVVQGGPAGDLENAFVSLPVAGKSGQWTLTAGQFTPMMYQYDPINSLSQSLPTGLAEGADAFSFADVTPGLRLDFFNNRGQGTADGNYLVLGVPFEGQLSLNSDARLYGTRGVFAHAFQRRGKASEGVFGYQRNGNFLAGLLGTQEVGSHVAFLETANTGHDSFGTSGHLSLQAEYTPIPLFALTGRIEAITGHESDVYPVATATYYPFGQQLFRLTAETTQGKGNRSVSFFIFGQF